MSKKIYIRRNNGTFDSKTNYPLAVLMGVVGFGLLFGFVQLSNYEKPVVSPVRASEVSTSTTATSSEVVESKPVEVVETTSKSVSVTAIVITDVFPAEHDQRTLVINEYLKILGEESNLPMWNCILDGESRGTNHDLYSKGVEWYGDQAKGFFQIMDITWKDNGCGSRDSWQENVRCAVKNKEKKGFSDWEAYFSYCGGK